MAKANSGPSMQELRQKGAQELAQDARRLRGELAGARYSLASGKLTQTHTLRRTRKSLARILTAHTQVERAGHTAAGAP